MTSVYSDIALFLLNGLGIWEMIGFAILILLCPATMYFGMRGMGKRSDQDTKRKGKDTKR